MKSTELFLLFCDIWACFVFGFLAERYFVAKWKQQHLKYYSKKKIINKKMYIKESSTPLFLWHFIRGNYYGPRTFLSIVWFNSYTYPCVVGEKTQASRDEVTYCKVMQIVSDKTRSNSLLLEFRTLPLSFSSTFDCPISWGRQWSKLI